MEQLTQILSQNQSQNQSQNSDIDSDIGSDDDRSNNNFITPSDSLSGSPSGSPSRNNSSQDTPQIKTPNRTKIQQAKMNRSNKNKDTEDAELIDYPKNSEEYRDAEIDLINSNFTDLDCYKMIRTIDILHRTLDEALKSKKNIKTDSFVESALKNKTLYNYLKKIKNKSTTSLFDVLFDNTGNGIIIWGIEKTKVKNKERNNLYLAQLVNPNNKADRLDKVPKNKAKKGKSPIFKKKFNEKFESGDLTMNANSWLKDESLYGSSSSSALSYNYVTVEEYLQNPENYPNLIFDKLTTPKNGRQVFSLLGGELKVTPTDEYILLAIGRNKRESFNLENIGDYNSVLHNTKYLPFFQAYNRDLKVGNYKPNGNIENQREWREANPEAAITPIFKKKMYCALCGRKLVEKNDNFTYDVDHVWNLILDSLLNILDSPEGYFNTHDNCNRTFKSDKVFIPNIGIWKTMFEKASNYDERIKKDPDSAAGGDNYEWPGEVYKLNGLDDIIPEGGFKTFNIGYKEDWARDYDYSKYKIYIKNKDKLIKGEALNHKDILNAKWGNAKFNEFDLQLKFLKRTLKIAGKLQDDKQWATDADDDKIIRKMLELFLKEIVLLQVGAENMNTFRQITNMLERNSVDYTNLPLSLQSLVQILNLSKPDDRTKKFQALLKLFISRARNSIQRGHLIQKALLGPSTEGHEPTHVKLTNLFNNSTSITSQEARAAAKNFLKEIKKLRKNIQTGKEQTLTSKKVSDFKNLLNAIINDNCGDYDSDDSDERSEREKIKTAQHCKTLMLIFAQLQLLEGEKLKYRIEKQSALIGPSSTASLYSSSSDSPPRRIYSTPSRKQSWQNLASPDSNLRRRAMLLAQRQGASSSSAAAASSSAAAALSSAAAASSSSIQEPHQLLSSDLPYSVKPDQQSSSNLRSSSNLDDVDGLLDDLDRGNASLADLKLLPQLNLFEPKANAKPKANNNSASAKFLKSWLAKKNKSPQKKNRKRPPPDARYNRGKNKRGRPRRGGTRRIVKKKKKTIRKNKRNKKTRKKRRRKKKTRRKK